MTQIPAAPNSRNAEIRKDDARQFHMNYFVMTAVFTYSLIANIGTYVIGIITPGLVAHHVLTDAQIGNGTSLLDWLAIPMTLAAGWAADRWGPRIVGGLVLAVGAVLNFVFPISISGGYGSYLANRALFSAGGNGPSTPIGNRVVAETTSVTARGTGAALLNIGFPLSMLLLTALGGYVVTETGDNGAIYIVAALGVVGCIVWLVAMGHLPGIHEDGTSQRGIVSWAQLRDILVSRTLLGTGLAWGFSGYTFTVLAAWLPAYYTQHYHEVILTAGLRSSAPWIGGVIGGLVVGATTDLFRRRTDNLRKARLYLAAVGQLIFGIAIFIAAFTRSLSLAFAMFIVGELANEIGATLLQVIAIDTMPRKAGSATGYLWAFVVAGAALANVVTGHLFGSGNFREAFVIAGILPIIGGILLFTLVYPGELRPWSGGTPAQIAE